MVSRQSLPLRQVDQRARRHHSVCVRIAVLAVAWALAFVRGDKKQQFELQDQYVARRKSKSTILSEITRVPMILTSAKESVEYRDFLFLILSPRLTRLILPSDEKDQFHENNPIGRCCRSLIKRASLTLDVFFLHQREWLMREISSFMKWCWISRVEIIVVDV